MATIGQPAPPFTLNDADGNDVTLKDFRGKWIVLYFYPKDNTPGCTIEALDFTRLQNEFAKRNAVILGISKDSCASHKKFIKDKSLTVTLLSDPDAKAQQAFGVWRLKKFMGKEFLGTIRSTFLIAPDGTIARIWDPVTPEGHAQEVLDALAATHK